MLRGGFMQEFRFDPRLGKLYAESYALSDNVPENKKLFYYLFNDDCANFISQCVWASYGGWLPGFTDQMIDVNAKRVLADVRQVKGVWYGSKRNAGSNKWCRVMEFFSFATDKSKQQGPFAELAAVGGWQDIDPGIIRVGDVVQMVVSYDPRRFGHSLYVTGEGPGWEDVTICCHSDDRLNEPMAWFSQFPDTYLKLRVLKFGTGRFER